MQPNLQKQKRGIAMLTLFFILTCSNLSAQNLRYAVASGNWNNTSTWAASPGGTPGASVPDAATAVHIQGGYTVNITSNSSCSSVSVHTATLRFNVNASVTLNVAGDITVTAGSFHVQDAPGNRLHHLYAGGNITVDAGSTFNMLAGANDKCNVTFNGTATQLISGGAALSFNAVTSSNLSAGGVVINTPAAISNTTSLAKGTLFAVGAAVTFSGAVTVQGTFQLNTNGSVAGSGNWTYTNGSLIFNTAAVFNILSTQKFWPASNGPLHVKVLQGGINLGTNATASRTVNGSFETAGSVALSNNSVLTLNGDVVVNTGAVFNNAPLYGVSSVLIYNTLGVHHRNAEWNSTGTYGYPYAIIINEGCTVNITANGGTTAVLAVRGNLNILGGLLLLYNGTSMQQPFTVNGNISLGAAAVFVLSAIPGADLTVTGNWIKSSTAVFNPNERIVRFTGANTVLSGSTTFSSFVIHKTSATNTITLDANTELTATAALHCTMGKLVSRNTGAKVKALGTVTGAASSSYINGTLEKNIAATGSYTFEVGDNTAYLPVNIQFETLDNPGGLAVATTATIAAAPGSNTLALDASKSINRHWTVTATGLLSGTYAGVFSFVNAAGADRLGVFQPAQLRSAVYNGPGWHYPGMVSAANANSITTPLMSSFGTLLFASQRTVLIQPAAVQPKIYDGTNAAIITGNLTGVVSPDEVYVNREGVFASVLPGVAIPVTANCSLYGTNADNYLLVQPGGLLGTILPADINTADFKSKSGGNFSAPATWLYHSGGGTWADATQPPSSTNNILIQPAHKIVLDDNLTIGSQKILQLQEGSSVDIAPNSTLAVDANGTIDFNGQPVTLKSTIAGSGSIGKIAGTLTGDTKVTVERYLPANTKRAYRLLSVPVKTSQTIHQAWQEGDVNTAPAQDSLPGYGTIITGKSIHFLASAEAGWAAGFDTLTPQASIMEYKDGAWAGFHTTHRPIETRSGYFLYIRGDRSQWVSDTNVVTSPLTLRATGSLYKGDVATPWYAGGKYACMGNIYPAAVQFENLIKEGGISNSFYVWDAKKTSAGGNALGAYELFSAINDYECLFGGGSWQFGDVNDTIQPGQAVMLYVSGDSGRVIFTEAAKAVQNNLRGLRPAAPLTTVPSAKITARLFALDRDSITAADATVVVFNEKLSNDIDYNDVIKMELAGENFSVKKAGSLLAVEGRQPVLHTDTIQFAIKNLKKGRYKISLLPVRFAAHELIAVLKDKYLGKSTLFVLSNSTEIFFEVNGSAASAASDRFEIILSRPQTLALTFVSFKAKVIRHTAQLEWMVADDNHNTDYELQRSIDGNSFSRVAVIPSSGLGKYQYAETMPAAAAVYYRVKTKDESGKLLYTQVLKLQPPQQHALVSVQQQDAGDRNLTIVFNAATAARYTCSFINSAGQLLYTEAMDWRGGSGNMPIKLPSTINTGVYHIRLQQGGKLVSSIKIVVGNHK
ncbi:MAG TPA: YDG domain-containing protein [Ferruginibacter sp.]|nr:YDG domain-containing protein [Ferruginibacter sp.]HMP21712.1 YDG domain-containing protein [Ferruginibacter sp.]